MPLKALILCFYGNRQKSAKHILAHLKHILRRPVNSKALIPVGSRIVESVHGISLGSEKADIIKTQVAVLEKMRETVAEKL